MPGGERRIVWIAGSVLAILAVVFVAQRFGADGAASSSGTGGLPVLLAAPRFSLVDQGGRAFGSEELRGKVWIADFFFTTCRTVCPLMTSKMGNLQQRLLPLGDRVHLVSITVDPENDTPERLRDYAQRYRARPGTWSFLTGSPDYVRRTVVDGFKQVMEPAPGGETSAMSVLHGTRFMLFDRRARLRGLYETDAERLSDLARDATTLTSESER